MAEGFEAPIDVFASLMGGNVLDAPGVTGYLAEVDGRPAATGLGVMSGGAVGVFNISVVPSARRRGLGRAMTVLVMADGFAAGADAAFLHPSRAGLPLYESLGRDLDVLHGGVTNRTCPGASTLRGTEPDGRVRRTRLAKRPRGP
jgi:hypothetical protein